MDFEQFYIVWYSRVKHFAQEYVISEAEAENITQDVFMDLYERRDLICHHINITAYLFTCVKNKCLDCLRREVTKQHIVSDLQNEFDLTIRMKFDSLEALNVDFLTENTVEETIDKALLSLPEKCRRIFIMSKIEGKKQKVIAEELNITVNTVESQMSIAYKKLREELKDCLPILLFLI